MENPIKENSENINIESIEVEEALQETVATEIFIEVEAKIFQDKPKVKEKIRDFFTARRIAYIGVFVALATILYAFASFSLPIFPGFLSMDLSNIPVLISGFMLGPVAGVIVVIIKTALKLAFVGTRSSGVGELGDILLGIAFVVPAAIVYKIIRGKKGAGIGLAVGGIASLAMALLANRFILIPFFASTHPLGMQGLVNMVKSLYPNITVDTFYRYFLLYTTIPFNLIRILISAPVAFGLYCGLKKADRRLFPNRKREK